MNKKYMYLLIGILGIVIVIVFMNTKRLTNELDNIQKRNDKLYIESANLLASAMNFNYKGLVEEDRLQHLTQFYEKIGLVESVYPYTSYYDKDSKYTLELAMNELKIYFRKQWMNDFEEYEQTQTDVYNLILNLSLNPEVEVNINLLYEFLVQYND